MEREESTLRALLEYLRKHGYPEESLAVEYPIAGKYRTDVAVVDPSSRLPVAIFELKGQANERSRALGHEQLHRFLRALGTESVQAYLVWTTDSPPLFEIERYNPPGAVRELDAQARIEGVPFGIQRETTRSERVAEKRSRESRWRAWLIAVASALAAILFALLGLELAGAVSFGTSALLLLGGACVAVLIPFYDRVKFYGIELQRLLGRDGKEAE